MKGKDKKEVSASLKTLVKTSGIVLVGLFLSKILTYIYRIVAARYFGPEAYGLLSLALVISGWFIAIATLGLAEGLIRYISIYKEEKKFAKINYIIKYSTILLSITSIILGILMFILARYIAIGIFHEPKLIIFLQVFSLSVPITVIAAPFLSSIRAYEHIGAYSGIFNILQNFVKTGLLVLFIVLGVGPQALNISYIGGLAIVLIAAYYYAKTRLSGLFVKRVLDEKEKKISKIEVLSYSWPLMFYGILVTILYWIDTFSIGYYKDATAVGFYNAAVPVAILLSIAPELFTQLFLPMINRYYASKQMRVIKELSKQVTKWVLLINLPAFILMFLFSGIIINILFGSEYLVATTALKILAISSLISSLGFIPLHLISMTGKSRIILMNIMIASAVNFVLNSIFVPMHKIWFIDNTLGINGASLATLISIVIFNILFFVQTYNYTNIFPLRRKMFNVIIAMVPSIIIAFYLQSVFVKPSIFILGISGIIFIALYIACLLIFKAVDKHDSEIIFKIREKITSLIKR